MRDPIDGDPESPQEVGVLGAAVVSICIPTFNRAGSLGRAVNSALSQEHEAIEVIISDNASSDGTAALCDQLQRSDPRVRLLRNRTNLGPTENFNRVRAEAQGDFVMWLGDDDWIPPGYVGACLREFDQDPTLALVTGRVVYEHPAGVVTSGARVEVDEDDGGRRVLSYYRQVGDNGTFYGLSPRWVVDSCPPMPTQMGNDWFHLAATAYLGGFRTADTEIRRSTGGATRSLRHAARSAGFTWIEGAVPQIAIAVSAAADIVRSPVYRELGSGRWALSVRCASIVLVRFVPGAAKKFGLAAVQRVQGISRSLIWTRRSADG